jgi:hypothetical protein
MRQLFAGRFIFEPIRHSLIRRRQLDVVDYKHFQVCLARLQLQTELQFTSQYQRTTPAPDWRIALK